jgi:hypothetical protein
MKRIDVVVDHRAEMLEANHALRQSIPSTLGERQHWSDALVPSPGLGVSVTHPLSLKEVNSDLGFGPQFRTLGPRPEETTLGVPD